MAEFPDAIGHAASPKDGLSLPWKLAIGAVLLANLTLVYLWRTDRNNTPPIAQTSVNHSTASQQPTFGDDQPANNQKKTLPGIASPKDLPPPRRANSNTSQANSTSSPVASGTGRTFRPSGRPITIAGEPGIAEPRIDDQDVDISSPQTSGSGEPSSTASTPGGRVIPQQPEALAPSARARSASALSALSDGAREALYALSFSFHICGVESDLRSVGVNGQRITEGQTVTTDNGETFTIGEITDSGAIVEFQHDGESLSVAIPVMEDWKDS